MKPTQDRRRRLRLHGRRDRPGPGAGRGPRCPGRRVRRGGAEKLRAASGRIRPVRRRRPVPGRLHRDPEAEPLGREGHRGSRGGRRLHRGGRPRSHRHQARDAGPHQRRRPPGRHHRLQHVHHFHRGAVRAGRQPGAVPRRALLQPVAVHPRRGNHPARRHIGRHHRRRPRTRPRRRQADRRRQGRHRLRAQPPAVRAVPRGRPAGGAGHRDRGGHRHPGPHHLRLPAAVLRTVRHRRHGRTGRLQLLLQVAADGVPGTLRHAEDPQRPRGRREAGHQDRRRLPQRPGRAHARAHRLPQQGLRGHAEAHRGAWPRPDQLGPATFTLSGAIP